MNGVRKLACGVALCLLAGVASAATVIYSAATSSGSGDGSSWANRMAWTDAYVAARAASGEVEIRLTGDVTISSIQDTQTIANNLTIRGGFIGSDENPEARASADAKSTFTGNDNYEIFPVKVTGSLAFENVIITCGKTRGVDKSGAGNISFVNCSLSGNGREIGHNTSNAIGNGLQAKGGGVVTLKNCDINGNGPYKYSQNGAGGWGVYAESATRVFIDDCNFVTNGVWLDSKGNGWGQAHKGLALYLKGSPATIRNTKFAGNVSKPSGNDAGGAVYFEGACGDTAMTNCTFVGNQDLVNGTVGIGGGICIFYPNSDAATLDVSGCTFAYNLTLSRMSAAGLAIRRGQAHVTDSTFFHNVLGYEGAHGWGSDVSVHDNGTLKIEKTHLTSLTHSVSCANPANLAFDTATMTTGDPGFTTSVLDVEQLMNFGIDLSYKKDAATYTQLALLDLTTGSRPAKPDVGAGSVLYVKADATGTADGSSWANAFTTLDAALAAASAKKHEIWIAGDLAWTADGAWTRIETNLAVRGGFAGTESSAADRTSGARSTLSGANNYDLVRVSVDGSATLAFENIVFTTAKYRAVEKRDCGSLKFANCRFLNNGRTQVAAGKGIYAPSTYGIGTLTVTNCQFEGQMRNSRSNSSGQFGEAVYVAGHDRFVCDESLFMSNGTIIANGGTDNRGLKGAAIYGYATPATVRRTRFAANIGANRSTEEDGGIVRFEGYLGKSAFTNCAFVGNYAFIYRDGQTNYKCGTLVLVPGAADSVDIENCTFAYNLSQGTHSPGALNVYAGTVNVHNSIFWHNVHGDRKTSGIGSEIDVKGGVVNVSHSILTGTSLDYCHSSSATGLVLDDASVYTIDPGFVTPAETYEEKLTLATDYINPGTGFNHAFLASLDVHLLSPQKYYLNDGTVGPETSAYSSAIDKGDPATACVEPIPNGSRVNLGAYGNTKEASLTAIGQPKVDSFTIDYKDGYTRPYAELKMGIASGKAYFATVVITCKVDGVVFATKTFTGVQNCELVSWGVPRYFETTDNLEISYGISADGATSLAAKTDTKPTGKTKPGFCDHGGGATVVHVREGADCAMDGSDWEDAYPTLKAALAAGLAGKSEIWIARATEDATATLALSASLAIRGGFVATEDAASERTADTRTTFAYAGAINGFEFSNAVGVTLELDRLVFQRASTRAVKKTGAGDLVVRDCRFTMNGRGVSDTSGKGLHLSGTASSTLVTVTNCVFDGNMADLYRRGEGGGSGAAIYAENLKRLTIDDSLFASNGMQTVENDSSYYCYYGAMNGAALYATTTPVTMRRTRVTANALGNCSAGGVVFLNGNCTGSCFTNCAFVGNFERMDNLQNASNYGGALVINMGGAGQTCDLEGCTIAYNVTDSKYAAGGLNVVQGKVTVKDSIIWQNYRNRYRTAAYAEDIEVKGGTCVVSYSTVTGKGTDKCRGAAANSLTLDTDTVTTDDPMFVSGAASFDALFTVTDSSVTETAACKYSTLSALDVHLLSAERYYLNDGTVGPKVQSSSPVIDAGDPVLVCVEPNPNGNRVNRGAYGNTKWASATATGTPKVDSFALTLPTEYTRPRATLAMGIAQGSDYKASVTLYCKTNGLTIATKEFTGVKNGDTLVWDVPFYFAGGTSVTVAYAINAEGCAQITSSDDITATGTLPAFAGKGGGANVLHVRAGADCLLNGANWTDAFADLGQALATVKDGEKAEVWIAEGNYQAGMTAEVRDNLRILGGFRGTENAASERPAGTYATLAHGNTVACLTISNAAPNAVYVERLVFKNGMDRGFAKTSSGDLTMIDCVFENNGLSSHNNGRGLYATGGGKATLALTNCIFRGNMCKTVSDDLADGGAIYVTSCAQALLDSCLFETNGFAWQAPGAEKAGNCNGGVLYCEATRLNCTKCRFAANAGSASGGGIIRLQGACGGSVFENCAIVGNYETTHWVGATGGTTAGALAINLNSASATVTVRNCTIAHNVCTGRDAAGGLNVVCGTVRCYDSILWANQNGWFKTEQELHDSGPNTAHDIAVAANGRLYCTNTLVAATARPYAQCDASGTLVFGGNVVTSVDPLFVTTTETVTNLLTVSSTRAYYGWEDAPTLAAFNAHLKGGTGYRDESTGALVTEYRRRAINASSPAIDASTRRTTKEPKPNGKYVNLGCYGDTPWATMSPNGGCFLIVR